MKREHWLCSFELLNERQDIIEVTWIASGLPFPFCSSSSANSLWQTTLPLIGNGKWKRGFCRDGDNNGPWSPVTDWELLEMQIKILRFSGIKFPPQLRTSKVTKMLKVFRSLLNYGVQCTIWSQSFSSCSACLTELLPPQGPEREAWPSVISGKEHVCHRAGSFL